MEDYDKEEIEEIEKIAKRFKRRNWFRLPALIRGNKVASRNPESKVRNFSTITGLFQLSSGKWIFLVYSYPLSIVHRLLDGLSKWATEKYCIEIINPKKWKDAFVRNSFIPVIPINVPAVVAMPYIENENLFDIFTNKVGSYSFLEKLEMIRKAVDIINKMHAKNIVWGELIIPNMIRTLDRDIILCDTETVYYRGGLLAKKASDWLDFIFSAVGAMNKIYLEEVEYLVRSIFNQIEDRLVKIVIRGKCHREKSFLHRLFSFYDEARLGCSPDLYDEIKKFISSKL